jgi:hypothetical protein
MRFTSSCISVPNGKPSSARAGAKDRAEAINRSEAIPARAVRTYEIMLSPENTRPTAPRAVLLDNAVIG